MGRIRRRFAPEAWGPLLALSGRGASAAEMEQVIERAMRSRWRIAWTIFGAHENSGFASYADRGSPASRDTYMKYMATRKTIRERR